MSINYQLRNNERFTRFVIGFALVFSILIVPFTAEEIILVCVIAIYPLITSLIALDPVFYILDNIISEPGNIIDRETTMAL